MKTSHPISPPDDNPFCAPEMAACAANYQPLTPLSFLDRSARIHGEMTAVIDGDRSFTWRQTAARARRLANALDKNGIVPGDVVAVMLANSAEFYEAMFGVPMAGAVINPLNTRLDAATLGFILQHGGAKIILVDIEFAATIEQALASVGMKPPLLVVINHPAAGENADVQAAAIDYEYFLQQGDETPFPPPADEWQALALSYTSGTTGNPKGVVYSHRGAWMTAVGNILSWQIPRYAPYVWTLPMFHCCGWCFPWTMAALAGVNYCPRKVSADSIAQALAAGGEYFCGAPIVLTMLIEALEKQPCGRPIHFMVAAAPPPAAVLQRADEIGIRVQHVYGLTETYGPSVVCDWKPAWDTLPADQRTDRRSRQGAPYLTLEHTTVADSETRQETPPDGETIGEVMMRGNIVMKGYFKNPQATEKAFAGGWFHSGDLGVMEADGYLRLKDRAKDIIISGGENISSIEVEDTICRHPAVAAAAVVAQPDEKWGETPLAYVEIKGGKELTEAALIAYCRDNLAHFKCPRNVIFGVIPRTVTGKVQKFRLREKLNKS